jgi:hypothetical protein
MALYPSTQITFARCPLMNTQSLSPLHPSNKNPRKSGDFYMQRLYQALPVTFRRAAWVKSSMRLSGLIALGIKA